MLYFDKIHPGININFLIYSYSIYLLTYNVFIYFFTIITCPYKNHFLKFNV